MKTHFSSHPLRWEATMKCVPKRWRQDGQEFTIRPSVFLYQMSVLRVLILPQRKEHRGPDLKTWK